MIATACSGICVPELAAHRLGWRSSFACEIAAFPRRVLAERFPDTRLFGDVTKVRASDLHRLGLPTPDGWTALPGAADTPRYEAIGNAMALPVVEWVLARIGRQIEAVRAQYRANGARL